MRIGGVSNLIEPLSPCTYPPVVVLKAKSLQGQYFPKDLRNWKYDYSTNGWFTSKICLRWLREVFIPETQPGNKNDWRQLILDGAPTHLDADFMHTAWSNKIQLIYLPPHTSHRTQPLDLAVFAPLKTAYAQQTAKLKNYDHSAPIQKRRFLSLYYAASDKSITARNISMAGSCGGVVGSLASSETSWLSSTSLGLDGHITAFLKPARIFLAVMDLSEAA